MAVLIATVESQINAIFNYATTYTATVSDPRAYSQFIADNALAIDGQVIEAICSNPLNSQRLAFITSATVAHAGALPARIGPIDSVLIAGVPAAEASLTEITWDRSTSLTYLQAKYAIFGNRLFHNQGATSATVYHCTYTRTSALQSPDEYGSVVVCGTASISGNVEGEDVASVNYYASQYQAMLQSIRAGQAPMPFRLERAA
jgi:hypothetical protein